MDDSTAYLGANICRRNGLINGYINEFRIWEGAMNDITVNNNWKIGPNGKIPTYLAKHNR